MLHRAEKLGDRASQAGATAREVELLSLQLRKLQKVHADEMVQADVQGQLADALDRELGFGDAAVSATN